MSGRYVIEGRHKGENKMRCAICGEKIEKGKTYFNVEIEYNTTYDIWLQGYSICKDCFEKYTKEELVSKIENKRRENNVDD
jgi:ribosomal protein L34E